MVWELKSDRPIYTQLLEELKRRIVAGDYKPGEKLLSVREFAQEAKVNPNTMQRALAELEDIGLVHSMRTSGRFVTEDTELITKEKNGIAADYVEQYYKQMLSLGYSVEDMVELLLQYKKERGEEDESGRM